MLEHNLLRNKVLDGDNYIIHVQVWVGGGGWGGENGWAKITWRA